MKIVMVFSPFIDPSYIPVGIAQLKSYAEQQLSFVKVRNIDLNNAIFNNLTKKEFRERFKNLCLSCAKRGKRRKQIIKTKFDADSKLYVVGNFCLRDNNSGEFYNAAKYNSLYIGTLKFFNYCKYCLVNICDDVIKNKHKIPKVLDNFFREDINKIINERPDIVGFSIFSNEQLTYSLILARILKKRGNTAVIFGGAFMSHIDITEFLGVFDSVDFVVSGEGEIALTEFLRRFKSKDFKNVPGLFYREGNKILHNKEEFVRCLDSIPFPDISDFDVNLYFSPVTALTVIFSRGCFWNKCAFCNYYKNYPTSYRVKSVEKFIQELKYFVSMGIRYFMLCDDAVSAHHLNLISNAIIKEKMRVFFGVITRPDKDFSLKVLKNIYHAGGRYFSWGVETSNQRLLDLVNKGTNIKDIEMILKNAVKIGFTNHLFMIQGFPTQTQREIINDIKFLKKHSRNTHFFMHNFILFQGSFVFDNPEKFEIKNFRKIPLFKTKGKVLYSGIISFKRANELDWEEIRKKMRILNKKFPRKFENLSHLHGLIHGSLKCA